MSERSRENGDEETQEGFEPPVQPHARGPEDLEPSPRPLPPPPEDAPAPVVSEEGTFGRLPPAPLDVHELEDHGGGARRVITWLAAIGLVIAAAAWLLALSAEQATAPAVAVPAIERNLAVLTDAPTLLEIHREEIAASGVSRAGDPTARVEVPGFPIPEVTLTALEARDATPQMQRRILLRRAALLIYERGPDVFRAEDAPPIDTATFSTAGGLRRLFSALSTDNHEQAEFFLWPLGAAALVLLVLVLAVGRGFGRFIAAGLAVTLAAGLTFAVAMLLRLGLAITAGEGSALDAELAATYRTLTWTPARNAIWTATAGAALFLPSVIVGLIFSGSGSRASARERERHDDRRVDAIRGRD